MRILISNVYSWKNKGDAAIVLSMVEHLRESFPGCSITLSSYDVEDCFRFEGLVCTRSLLSLMREKYGGKRIDLPGRLRYALSCLGLRFSLAAFRLCAHLGVRCYCILPPIIRGKMRDYETMDLVVACGGGYLISKGRVSRLERLLDCRELHLLCLDFSLAALSGKPYLLYNQSVGPFSDSRDAAIVRRHLLGAEAVICREELTVKRLDNMGLRNLVRGADIAFHLRAEPSDALKKYGYDPDHKNIGLTVRNCLPTGRQGVFESEMAAFISESLSSDPGLIFYFMPQVIFREGSDNDLLVSRRVQGLVDSAVADRAIVVDEDLHPAHLRYVIGQMDAFIGNRMHSCIFALSGGVKTIAVSYEPKTAGIMAMLGLSSYVVAAGEVKASLLRRMLSDVERDESYLPALREALKDVLALAKQDLLPLAGRDSFSRGREVR